ncbi:MAG: zinc carboxypeptidase [Flavobacteriaceae bacterium]|nr:zinc carboxypeptidase [Flavobacteriaceae bacterium]
MQTLELKSIEQWYSKNQETSLSGLRILFDDIEPLIKNISSEFKVELLGNSNLEIPIYKISIGTGEKRILIWSQMHGNESTGTKAVFDLINFLENPEELKGIHQKMMENTSIMIIPMLNPDGAIAYTRENNEGIDLNRDAVGLKAKESNYLREILESFNPQFCFNLHDQRTIFNVKDTRNPATISFLAPSEEITREVTEGRTETMSVIVSMNSLLQQCIPGHVGRYTDEYYPTATGDNFQRMGFNTILIEAGHYKDDYDRELVRKFNFFGLLQGLYFLASTNDYSDYQSYFDIPNNDKKFYDILYKNGVIVEESKEKVADIGVLFKYKVVDSKLVKYNYIESVGDLSECLGHLEIDLDNTLFNYE